MRIAVYCGSRPGNLPIFEQQARALGDYLASQNIDLVYGGGRVGLMGSIADSMLDGGSKVYGVIPERLFEKEVAHDGCTELFVVPDMHTRKAKMMELADGFVAMPGGAGTLEEMFEAFTWWQIGYHEKRCAFYNIAGYYDPLLAMLDTMVEREFLLVEHRDAIIVEETPEALLSALS